jgi:hypothetical protein
MGQTSEIRVKPTLNVPRVETQSSLLKAIRKDRASCLEDFSKSCCACSSQFGSLFRQAKMNPSLPPALFRVESTAMGTCGPRQNIVSKGGRTMRSINPDGSVTARARALLCLLDKPLTPEEISQTLGQPLYHVKTSLRELVISRIIDQMGERFVITERGREKR